MDDDRRESGMDSAFAALEGAARIDESALALQAPARAKRRGSPRAARVELPAAPAPLAVEAARPPEMQPVSSAEEPVVKSKRKARRGASLPPTAAEEQAAEPAAETSSELAPRGAIESAAEVPSSAESELSPRPVEASAPVVAEAAAEVANANPGEFASARDDGAPEAPAKARKKRGRKAEASAGAAEAPAEFAPAAAAPAEPAELAELLPAPSADPGAAIAEAEALAEPELAEEASAVEADATATSAGGELDLPAEESGLERIEDRQLLAVLFGSPEELTVPRLAEILGWKRRAVEQRLPRVRDWLDKLVLPFELRLIAGGWRLVSRSEYAELLGRLRVVRRRDRLSQAALEVLSVVAYKQPVPASEVDRIRGVNCSSILRLLLDRELVHVVGRQDSPGRPLLYGTTKLFLDRFGLGALHDLPGIEVAHDGYAAADDIAIEDLPSAEEEGGATDAAPAPDGDDSASASETSV